jgi:hypothetical protein
VAADRLERPPLLLRIILGRELHPDGRQVRRVKVAHHHVELVDLVELPAVVHV